MCSDEPKLRESARQNAGGDDEPRLILEKDESKNSLQNGVVLQRRKAIA